MAEGAQRVAIAHWWRTRTELRREQRREREHAEHVHRCPCPHCPEVEQTPQPGEGEI